MGLKNKPMNFATEELDKFRTHDPERADEPVKESAPASEGSNARITKTVRMRERFSLMLKEEAFRRSKETKSKVSEADLLDEALEAFRVKLSLQEK